MSVVKVRGLGSNRFNGFALVRSGTKQCHRRDSLESIVLCRAMPNIVVSIPQPTPITEGFYIPVLWRVDRAKAQQLGRTRGL